MLTNDCRAAVCDFGVSQWIQHTQRSYCLSRVSRSLDDSTADADSVTTGDSWSTASTKSSQASNEVGDSGRAFTSKEDEEAWVDWHAAQEKIRRKINKVNARTIEKYRWMAPEALRHIHNRDFVLFASDTWR